MTDNGDRDTRSTGTMAVKPKSPMPRLLLLLCMGLLHGGCGNSRVADQMLAEQKRAESEAMLDKQAAERQRQEAAARSAAPSPAAEPDHPAGSVPSTHDFTLPGDPPTLLSKEEQEAGWISLFDGHSLFGWVPNDPEVNWSVSDGAITADSGPIGLLLTTVPFADYELVCQYRMSPGGNSGIFLRTIDQPKNVATDCYEINIADAHPEGYLTASIVGRAKPEQPILGSGDWAELRVVADGNQFTISHNGKEVLQYTDEANTRKLGRIGLQKNKGKIEFRRVALRPLAMQSLFNGSDLAGWREVPGSKSTFSVEDGAIRVRSGQGFLETENQYRDFLFQAQAMTHAHELNSGFFFRAQPGTEAAPSNGYEVQIHNGFADGNRWRPTNAGTGAIFRRVEARRVVSNDHAWFTTTLVASGRSESSTTKMASASEA